MKRLVTLFSILLISGLAWGQCANLITHDTEQTINSNDYTYFNFEIENLQANDDSFMVSFEKECPQDWTVLLCIEGVCLLPFIQAIGINVLAAEPDSGYFTVTPNGVDGMGTIDLSTWAFDCPMEIHTEELVLHVGQGVTSVGPVTTDLIDSYPNPFNPSTTIDYALTASGVTELNLYSMDGKLVREIVSPEFQIAGDYSVTLSGADLASGVYMLDLQTSGLHKYHRITLVK